MKNLYTKIALSIALTATQSFAMSKQETIDKIKSLPIAKAHKFTPTDIRPGGSLIFAKGYFKTPKGNIPVSMFISEDFKSAVYGRGYSTENGQEYRSFDMSELEDSVAFTYGNGPDEYYLVIDPLCPVCVTFEKTLPKFKDEAKIHFVFLPLTHIHPTAPQAVAYILSQKTDEEKWNAVESIAKGDKSYESIKITPDVSKQIQKQEKMARELGTRGTPTLYDKNANEINRGVLEFRHSLKNKQKVAKAN